MLAPTPDVASPTQSFPKSAPPAERAPLGRVAPLLLVLVACRRTPQPPPLFELLPPSATGVTFANQVPEQDTALNIITFLNYYNGGGVAVGDVDGDGLPDLYFTSNVGPNRLYRNLGNYRFEDIAERAGVADPAGWKTGVTMADVNGNSRPSTPPWRETSMAMGAPICSSPGTCTACNPRSDATTPATACCSPAGATVVSRRSPWSRAIS